MFVIGLKNMKSAKYRNDEISSVFPKRPTLWEKQLRANARALKMNCYRGGNVYGALVGGTIIDRIRRHFFGAPVLFLP